MPYRVRLPENSPDLWKIQLTEGNCHRHVTLALARMKREPVPKFSGTGCVMVAGGKRYLRMAFQTLSRMRDAGMTFPVDIWHLGPQELPSGLKCRFDHLNVRFVDALQMRRKHPARRLGGWEAKWYAIAHSPYQRVVLLDADCLPIRDPMGLFDTPEFAHGGSIVAPDIRPNRPSDLIFALMGMKKPDDFWEGESGFVMIDKTRRWRELQLVRWMNDFSEFFFRYAHGEKDHLIFASLRLNAPFKMLPKCTWEGFGIRHYWFDGSILCDHRLDRKRNPKAPVSPEDLHYGKVFDEWGALVAAA